MGSKLKKIRRLVLKESNTFKAFESVLEIRFRQLPGHRKIKRREYALQVKTSDRDLEQSLAINRCFLPGQRIDMIMVFDGGRRGLVSCPGCHFVTSKKKELVGSHVQWYYR